MAPRPSAASPAGRPDDCDPPLADCSARPMSSPWIAGRFCWPGRCRGGSRCWVTGRFLGDGVVIGCGDGLSPDRLFPPGGRGGCVGLNECDAPLVSRVTGEICGGWPCGATRHSSARTGPGEERPICGGGALVSAGSRPDGAPGQGCPCLAVIFGGRFGLTPAAGGLGVRGKGSHQGLIRVFERNRHRHDPHRYPAHDVDHRCCSGSAGCGGSGSRACA